ncbi:MAG: hypothetical protein E7635_06365 [Ruminococcaceae bacterium]|nr:hypothetical protein [Oscillospiraceae bacterium]
MKCSNDFCLHNNEAGKCMLRKIEVNECGMCAECLQITFTREEKEEKRANMLRAIIERERGDIEVELTEEDIDKLLS